MKSTIEAIYYGRVNCEHLKPKGQYKKYCNKFYDEYDKLKSALPKNFKEPFDNIIALRDDMEAESGLDNFKYGFETGLKIGMEIALK